MSLLKATRSHALLILAGTLMAGLPSGHAAAAHRELAADDGIVQMNDGTLQLSVDAPSAPAFIGDWNRYGLWDSPKVATAEQFQTIRVHYQADAPTGTAYYVAVRASSDGQRWSEWEWDVANDSQISFGGSQHWMQHRVMLLGTADQGPSVSSVVLTPEQGSRQPEAVNAEGVAPTYRLNVTRQGMVGRRTANGHRITKNDFFVSLPSWKSLSSKDGNEYMVRLSANGKSVVVRVADVGPWNRHDNYWDTNRERYKDLPRGWPEDHAAYYEGYNRGKAELGRVRGPTAVDIGDGAYWALGLGNSRATVNVTFLWLGADPGPNPSPINVAPSKRP